MRTGVALGQNLISIHAPREGGDLHLSALIRSAYWISIHAPREGGDIDIDDLQECMDISIHAPREGGDCASRRG